MTLARIDRRRVRVTRLADQGRDDDLAGTTASERVAMVWPLTVVAWSFMGEDVAQRRLQRDAVRVVRRGS